ncbi:protein of unknown function DUF1349 [Microseira wollei NIES-4236]|uniref:DUF1349 domain-containing protein n=2 Tax=Microseira wollei TaxID=467598 RepID=A0AAV3XFA1_9CYAN|nr:protein of unknown function DUF1349 [Microseira wollei NIES-4236]
MKSNEQEIISRKTTVMNWHNEPLIWDSQNETIKITSTHKTDFWRQTHYDFISDNAHFYYKQVTGDFIAEVKISGQYQEQYDQAGLMVRLDEANWLKCGIELIDGVLEVIVVVTHDYSDASFVSIPQNLSSIWMRVIRQGSALQVLYSLEGEKYTLLRLAHLTSIETVSVGVMCASPTGQGFPTTFEGFKVEN